MTQSILQVSTGQATAANSMPVTLPSDQGGLTVTDTAAEASLSTIATDVAPFVASGAGGYVRQDSTATIAKETGGNLATVVTNTGNIPAKGQTTMSASTPVAIASDQTAVPIKGTSTGSAVPSTALYMGMQNGSGQLTGVNSFGNINDTTSGNSLLAAGISVYNGSTTERMRSANTVAATTGTGLLGAGQLVWDGTNWQKQKADTAGVPTVNSVLSVGGTSLALTPYSVHITSNATTTPTAATAYISSISISAEIAGTTSTVTIQDKQGTPLKLVNGFSTTALTTTPTVVNFQTPVKMVSGIDIITAGAVAATVDVWVNYYQ